MPGKIVPGIRLQILLILSHPGRIQVYIRRDDICPEGDPTLYNTVFKKLLDIGDFIGVEGFAFHTNTGELSVHCRTFTVLSKSCLLYTSRCV